MDVEEIVYEKSPFHFLAIKNPIEKHTLIYDYAGGSLEPIYFWILDYLNNRYGKTYKLVDNFVASPGSSVFAEMGGRATRMQEEGMKILASANTVLKSIINILYDLKEFKIRINLYDQYRKGDKAERNSALLGLKQVWMDSVDIKRGNSSLKALAQQFDYVTLIDAFMVAKELEDVTKKPSEGGLDLNDRVRRLLQQRVQDFFRWLDESEIELKKRFEIEKRYLQSQVSSVQLYARWAKPYLESAKKLEQRTPEAADLVYSFNTSIMELKVIGESSYNPMGEIQKGDLPEVYLKLIEKKKIRNFKRLAIVEFRFISIPERLQQGGGYGHRGRVDITFSAYVLNEDELSTLKKEVEKDDLKGLTEMITGATDDSLARLQDDIDEFLKPKPKEDKNKSSSDDTNPFSALFSFLKSDKKSEEKGKEAKPDFSKGIPSDNDYEKAVRNLAIMEARKELRKLYDLYKKGHSMPAF